MKAGVDDLILQARRWRCTQLGVGVVSRNVVDVAIDVARRHRVRLMLVASRRQVDMASLGGGYVEGWTASGLADYVTARGGAESILLARDHGGPWQNNVEIDDGLDADAAMDAAIASFKEDIDAGFSILHIDPSVSPVGEPDEADILDRLVTLYDACLDYARSVGSSIAFEIGAEEQVNVASSMDRPRRALDRLREHTERVDAPMPLFCVVQTGTKVMERRNVGSLDAPYRIEGQLPAEIFIPRVLSMLSSYGVMLKQHNTDYLSSEVLAWHPMLGIHAANIAPEYGIEESLGLLELLEAERCTDLSERFLKLAYETRKWEKWEVPGSQSSDRERAIWAGHYVFSTPDFVDLKEEANARLASRDIDVDRVVQRRIAAVMERHVRAFRLTFEGV
jgi:hypothetical protein